MKRRHCKTFQSEQYKKADERIKEAAVNAKQKWTAFSIDEIIKNAMANTNDPRYREYQQQLRQFKRYQII